MPLYRYADPVVARTYPETRDASGRHLGTVQPGEERELDAAPDQWWVLVQDTAGDGAPGEPEQAGAPEDTAGASEASAPAAAPEPQPETSGPVPAPPAVIPGA